jgi:hypothetical protein
MRRRIPTSVSMVLAAVVFAGGLAFGAQPAQAASTIETTYKTRGGLAITWEDGRPVPRGQETPCAASPDGLLPHTVVYPSNISTMGPLPLIVWGNGHWEDDDITCYYQDAIKHLASWGYVVVAANNYRVADASLLGFAWQDAYLRANTAGDPLEGKIDFDRVGAIGNSEGAGGAAMFASANPNIVKSLAFLSLSDWYYYPLIGAPDPRPSVDALTMPTFFAREQLVPVLATLPATQAYYASTDGPAVMGTFKGSTHLDVGSRLAGKGYITAWFEYTLKGDSFARGAFVGSGGGGCSATSKPEICTNSGWANAATRALT